MKMKNSERTVAAIASGCQAGSIGVIRLSGKDALSIAAKIVKPKDKNKKVTQMAGYTALLGDVCSNDGRVIDECVVLVFRAPKSYTGEDVVEISCHGGIYVMGQILRLLFDNGAFPAEAGEFTKRAFLNGKLDLTKAESVMATIGAKGELALRNANAMRSGALYRKIEAVTQKLISLQAHAAAWSDFPEEDVPELTESELMGTLQEIADKIDKLISTSDVGKAVSEGIDTVICGSPNVGKSTLMNRLTGFERSIVTNIAGTTRDVVEETVNVDGIILRLADTAGLRDTDDTVEKIGVDRSRERIDKASLIIAVFDASNELTQEEKELIMSIKDRSVIAVINKCDLQEKIDSGYIEDNIKHTVYTSAAHDEQLSDFNEAVKEIVGLGNVDIDGGIICNERQLSLCKEAKEAVASAIDAVKMGMTLDAVTVCVDGALLSLCKVTGQSSSDTVIDEVFSTFCVGK